MRLHTTAALLAVALAAVACAGSPESPTAPTDPGPLVSTPPRPADPPQVPGERWNLSTTQTTVTGPAPGICWRNVDGTRIDWLMAVQRSAGSVSFLYDVNNWPTDHVEHKGTVANGQFVARSESWSGGFPCGGAQVQFVFDAEVSGRFSADGRALTAREVWTYRLASGDAVTIAFDWAANRAFN